MKRFVFCLSAVLLTASLVACGASADPDPSMPTEVPTDGPAYGTVTSEAGGLQVALWTGPEQPPARGVVGIELRITDASGAPVPGLTVSLQPFMPAMGHGTGGSPAVLDRGGGVYRVQDLSLYMAGTWELRFSFAGAVDDRALLPVQVR